MDWHGYKIGERSLNVGKLWGRKRICLYEVNGSIVTPLAYFLDEESAKIALDMIDAIMRAKLYIDEF